MSTRLGLISDVHASPAALAEALEIFAAERVDQIICAGDIAGYFDALTPTVELLIESGCRAVRGNHDTAWLQENADIAENSLARGYLSALPSSLQFELEGRRIYVVHAEPPDRQHDGIKLLNPDGSLKPERCESWAHRLRDFEHDLLIVGHTHQVYAERLGDVLVVNPGSVPFNHCCMVLTLPELELRRYALQGEAIIPCWNFGMLRG